MRKNDWLGLRIDGFRVWLELRNFVLEQGLVGENLVTAMDWWEQEVSEEKELR